MRVQKYAFFYSQQIFRGFFHRKFKKNVPEMRFAALSAQSAALIFQSAALKNQSRRLKSQSAGLVEGSAELR